MKCFTSLEHFVLKYPEIFPGMNLDQLQEQFLNYQLLSEAEIPREAKANVDDSEELPYCVDLLWGFLRGVNIPGTNSFELFKVAEAVMTIPHSNAGEETIFSLINKNKTPTRNSLKLDGTLSSLIAVKTHIDNPLQWQPSKTLLEKAKKTTRAYNEKHK